MLSGAGKGQTYNRLAELTDKFGHRLAGSQELEDSIDYMMDLMEEEGFDNVDGEPLMVPSWTRGQESCYLLFPREVPLRVMSLGSSVGTGLEGINASAVVVADFEELEALPDQDVQGKIVVYNMKYEGYGQASIYRRLGASRAAKRGAVAALVRSLTDFSIYSPHTGIQSYEDGVPRIPVASLTVEDAAMLHRMQAKGEELFISLYMEADADQPEAEVRNLVAEIYGHEFPNETVMFGGHIDSWDVGTGAMDDAGGCIISWQALSTIKALGLTPRRTMRMVMWTAEEIGVLGGNHYFDVHKNETETMVMALESDSGTFKPHGITFKGSDLALAIMEEILSMISEYDIGGVKKSPWAGGADIGRWSDAGVPSGSLWNQNDRYFAFHHSEGDTITVYNAHDLDLASITWTVTNYVVANMKQPLPRSGDYPTSKPLGGANSTSLNSILFCVVIMGVIYTR